MDEHTANRIKNDFEIWSGGFPPESDFQIYVYIDTAKSLDVADADLWNLLRTWMNEDEPTKPVE
jgi:hypothetical protein